MNPTIEKASPPQSAVPVPPEEIERRINEYCQVAFEHRATPVVVYSPPNHPCPWPGCDLKIAGFQLKLEDLVDPARMADCLKEFWIGLGLIGPCPSCGNLVAYGVRGKKTVSKSGQAAHLPPNWNQIGHVVLAKKS